jgi:hypothetical protein
MGEVHRRKEVFQQLPSSNSIPWSSRQARKKSSRLIGSHRTAIHFFIHCINGGESTEEFSLLFSIAIFQFNCFLKRIFV